MTERDVEQVWAENVQAGDSIMWAGRCVSVGQVEHGQNHQRGDVWLTIGHPDLPKPRRCHYWPDEVIKRVVGRDGE